ncbi:VOC family protein [Gorillibacterium massiliense]|uniref:VOC family protein n=1 Tax=Gorillibacterium massiliense TaxID=1280390 RepID=UPI0004AF618F|nr:VOC family protein [Gorillibacterium massiliense]
MAGTNKIIKGGGGFHHVAIKAVDFEKTVAFYTELLGFETRLTWGEGDGRGALLDTGDGNYLEVFAGGEKGLKPAGGFYHIALRTDDVDGLIERVRATGAEITVEPKDVVIQSAVPVPIRIAFFNGPDGESIELFQSTGAIKL